MTASRRALVAALLVSAIGCDRRLREPDAAVDKWSIDSASLVFTSVRNGNSDLYLAHLDGRDTVRLTTDAAQDSYARVSPNGWRIAFQSRRGGVRDDLFLMNADGSGVVNLTANDDYDVLPAWSPDGGRLAFMSVPGFELGEGGGTALSSS